MFAPLFLVLKLYYFGTIAVFFTLSLWYNLYPHAKLDVKWNSFLTCFSDESREDVDKKTVAAAQQQFVSQIQQEQQQGKKTSHGPNWKLLQFQVIHLFLSFHPSL